MKREYDAGEYKASALNEGGMVQTETQEDTSSSVTGQRVTSTGSRVQYYNILLYIFKYIFK